MDFNAPIPLMQRPKYSEGSGLASSRDDRNNSFLWKKGMAVQEQMEAFGQVIQKMSREIAKQRRHPKGGFVPTPLGLTVMPFTIYNITNSLNGGDTWRTFQIRDGCISARSKYWIRQVNNAGALIPADGTLPFNVGQSNYNALAGNNQKYLSCFQDKSWLNPFAQPTANPTIPAQPGFNQVKLNLLQDVLISGFDTNQNPVVYSQIVLADMSLNNGANQNRPGATFWIEIIDDPNLGFYANIWGRMVGAPLYAPAMQTVPFPTGNNIIPIGTVICELQGNGVIPWTPTGEVEYTQLLIGNPVNNFPSLSNSPVANAGNASITQFGQSLIWRGAWTANALSGQVFYPGDLVYDDSAPNFRVKNVSGGGNFTYGAIFIRTGAVNFSTLSPANDGGNWSEYAPYL